MTRSHDPLDKRLRTRLRNQRNEHCELCQGKRGPILYDVDRLHPLSFEADHIVPLARGGEKTWHNLQAAHRMCNRAKSDRLPGETTTTAKARTTVIPGSSCPPGRCAKCRGTHHSQPGVTFVTERRWKP